MIGIALCFAGTLTLAQPEDVDPVVKAKAQRALNDSHDLPPIPRGLTEPPPLPPPELHTHDIRRHRRSGTARKAGAKKKAQAPAKAAPRPQAAGAVTASKGKAPAAKAGQAKGGAQKAPQTPKKPAANQPKKS